MADGVPDNIRRILSEYRFEVDSDSISEDLNCTLCERLLLDAYQTGCGCKYCRECIVRYITQGNEYCRGYKDDCQEEVLILERNVFQNHALNRMVLKVRVHCPYQPCGFICQLTLMEEHLRVCNQQAMECPYTRIGCGSEPTSRDMMETHLQKEGAAHSRFLVEVIDILRNENGVQKQDIASLKDQLRLNESARNDMLEQVKEERRLRRDEREEMMRCLSMTEMLKNEGSVFMREIRKMREEAETMKDKIESVNTQAKEDRKYYLKKLEDLRIETKKAVADGIVNTTLLEKEVISMKKEIEMVRDKTRLNKGDNEALGNQMMEASGRYQERGKDLKSKWTVPGGSVDSGTKITCALKPLSRCPHSNPTHKNPNANDIDFHAKCSHCPSTKDNWICVTCHQVCCGRYVKGHMLEHFGRTGHPLVLSLGDLRTWCYKCQEFV